MSVHRKSSGQTGPEGKVEGRAPWGTAACVLGIVCAVSGGFFIDVILEFLGFLMGVIGYALGARRLGIATIVLSTALLLVFLAASQGLIPGIGPTDPIGGPEGA